jgi:hypothetical protein
VPEEMAIGGGDVYVRHLAANNPLFIARLLSLLDALSRLTASFYICGDNS